MDTSLIIQNEISTDSSSVPIECFVPKGNMSEEAYGNIRFTANNRSLEYTDCIFVFWEMLLSQIDDLEINGCIELSGWEGPSCFQLEYKKNRQYIAITINKQESLTVTREAFYSAVITVGSSFVQSTHRICPSFSYSVVSLEQLTKQS